MGFSIVKALGLGKKGPDIPAYEGPKSPTSIVGTEMGKKYRKTLEDRIAGIGVGYSPGFLDRGTAPYAKARTAYLQNYEMPQIASAASARGLGRSTIPVNRMALSSQEAGRDIEQRIADLATQNELLKRQEIGDALAKYGGLTSAEVAQQSAAAQEAQNIFNNQRNLAIQSEQDRINADRALNTQLTMAALSGAAGAAGGLPGLAAGSEGATGGFLAGGTGNLASVLRAPTQAPTIVYGSGPSGGAGVRGVGDAADSETAAQLGMSPEEFQLFKQMLRGQ